MHISRLPLTFLLTLSVLLIQTAPGISAGFDQPKIYELAPEELDLLLETLCKTFPDHDDRLKAIADLYLGATYNIPVIDESTEHIEWMPYQRTDCTTFVLFATAFLNSCSYHEALEHMRKLHYREGVVSYENRYHFTSDRITDAANPYFSDITELYVADPDCLQQVTLTLNQKEDGELLFGDRLGQWRREVSVRYIPRRGFRPEMLQELPRTLGVAFVKRSNWRLGVIVGHEGLLIDGDLYHSGSPQTGLHLIKDYLNTTFPSSDWEGLLFFSLNEVSD